MPETTASDNKVLYGLEKAHFATYTKNDDGTIVFDTPIPFPGAVELALDAKGDMIEFYADNILYYTAPNNQGYDGKLNVANVIRDFATKCLGEVEDETTGTQYEDADAKPKPFALLFQFEGDVNAVRHVVYNCMATRPSVASSTKTNSADPNVAELSYSATPVEVKIGGATKKIVKNKTTPNTPTEIYDNWFNEVVLPGVASEVDPGGA